MKRKTKQFAAASVTGAIITGHPESVIRSKITKHTTFRNLTGHTQINIRLQAQPKAGYYFSWRFRLFGCNGDALLGCERTGLKRLPAADNTCAGRLAELRERVGKTHDVILACRKNLRPYAFEIRRRAT